MTRVTMKEISNYERDHPFPECPRPLQGEAAVSPAVAREFQRAAFQWLSNHPALVKMTGGNQAMRWTNGNLAFWDAATDDDYARLAALFPGE